MPPKKKDTSNMVRRQIKVPRDLAAWMAWYASQTEQTSEAVVTEALRALYEDKRGNYPNGPTLPDSPTP